MNKSTPDKLYHGTKAKFTKFDLNKIGTGAGNSGAGIGVYFSTSLEEALSYGPNIYVVDYDSLKLKKSLSNFKRTLNKNQIIHILTKCMIYSEGESNYFQNYGDYNYNDYKSNTKLELKNKINQEIFQDFITWSDTDIISSFINSGSIEPPMLLDVLNKMDYTHTMDQWDDNLFKNSQHYILYFEPKIEERLTFKDRKSFEEYIQNIQL